MSFENLTSTTNVVHLLPIMMLYIGPETMLPLVSALAAIGGVLLMFWHRFVGVLRRLWRLVVRK